MAANFLERLNRARAGDQAVLDELLGRWRPLLRLQARVKLQSELASIVDSSDIVQETLTQAFRDLGQFRGQTEAAWVAWLRVIVAGQAAKTLRFHKAAKRDHDREVALTETFEASTTTTQLKMLMNEERAALVAAAIESLPLPMREVVERRTFDGEPFDSIARAVGRSPGAVRVLWTRAIRRLKELIDSRE